MTVRKFLVASALSLTLAAPAYAGVLGLGGSGGASIGVGGSSMGSDVSIGARTKTGAGGAGMDADGSADMGAEVQAPDISDAARGAARGDARAEEDAMPATGAVAARAAENLQSKGYSDVQLIDSAEASSGSSLKFDAVNPQGKNVLVLVDAQTGAVIREKSRL